MTVGVSTPTANMMLDMIGDVYIQMHTGDPGASGTSNVADMSDRTAADLQDAASGVRSLAAPVEWPGGAMWAGPAQTVTHVSAWTAATGGAFRFSAALASHVDFVPGLRPRLDALVISIPSLATN